MYTDRVRRGSIGSIKLGPGSPELIAGTMEEGFFGEVPASELITGVALASMVGISAGTSQFSSEGWLKFAYQGKIQFVAKKTIRVSINWNSINNANCVYGDKRIDIGGLTYKVRLMRALEPSNDPKTPSSASSGAVNHHSEWNRLICQIHEEAINKSWSHPNNIESNIGILRHNLGNGSQGMYSNADLNVNTGHGMRSWCQEMSASSTFRMARVLNGVSGSGGVNVTFTSTTYGWRPVLELV